MGDNLPVVRRRRFVQNLKSGDRVKFVGAGPNCTEGVVRDLNGGYVYIVCKDTDGTFFEIERYREEITERLSEFNMVPVTAMRLQYLLEQAAPEDINRKSRREMAQEELMDLLDQGQVFRTSTGSWGINPERRI
jgi:hypothetical protein